MNNKGFTLIELIASVVILAIVLLIALPAINNVAETVKKAQLNNVIEEVEINATRYAFDTGETLFFVEDLVQYGYMDSDEKSTNAIIDPVTQKNLACYGIEATKVGDYYTAKLLMDKDYKKGNECDRDSLINHNGDITISATYGGGITIQSGKWTKISGTTIKFKANILSSSPCNNSSNRCMWTSTTGVYRIGSNEIEYDVSNTKVKNVQFVFQKVNSDNVLKSSFELRIDNEEPKITNTINNGNGTYTIIANDGFGSGIAGYHIGSSCDGEYVDNKTLSGSAGQKVCVKDKVGNIASKNL